MQEISSIIKSLKKELDSIENEIEDTLQKAEQGIKITKRTLSKLNKVVVNHKFENIESEIHFFCWNASCANCTRNDDR